MAESIKRELSEFHYAVWALSSSPPHSKCWRLQSVSPSQLWPQEGALHEEEARAELHTQEEQIPQKTTFFAQAKTTENPA